MFVQIVEASNFSAMSQIRCLTIVGDSNVRRNLKSDATTLGRPILAEAQYVPGGRLSVLASTLASVRPESDACIIASITNAITGSQPSSSLSLRVEPILKSFLTKVVEFASSRSELQVFMCAPMYRTNPLWYRDGLPEILPRFSAIASSIPNKPPNFWLMPSFPSPQLESDGVHLNPFSGLQYILHLHSAAQRLLDDSSLDEAGRISVLAETSRSLEDRVAVIEQDHAELRRSVDHQRAIAAELFDYEANIRSEAFFMIQGLPRLPKLDQKEWQVRAVSDVNQVLADLGFDFKASYVQNSTGRGKDSRTLYKVRLESAEMSKKVRDKFSSFFAGGKDARPAQFSQITVRNCVTPGTLARIAILQLLAKHYRDSNPGARAHVVAYESRPVLKLTPPPDASDRRIMTMNYIEAITKLPTCFSAEEIESLLKRISPSLHGSLKSTLVVLSDDMLKSKSGPRRKKSSPAASADPTSGSESSEFRTPELLNGRKRARVTPGSRPAAKKK